MSQITHKPGQSEERLYFRNQLHANQPEVLRWLEHELKGPAQRAAVELAARYFATTDRLGDPMPMLNSSRLKLELERQMLRTETVDAWTAGLPLLVAPAEQRSLACVLRALVRVCQDKS
jgi:hypothetical protein